MWRASLVFTVSAVLLPACAGQNTSLRSENRELASELSDLRTEARRERVRMRDLEKRMAMLKASQVQDAQLLGSVGAEARPDLPIEVREPMTFESESDLPDDYEIVGLDGEGVQIVYVGEAASDEVIKISASRYDLDDDQDDSYDYDDEPIRQHKAAPAATDRLPVTQSVPTIASQLRQARKPATQVRNRAHSFGDPRAEYRRYYDALRAGNHSYAVTGFRNFVERFPAHDFADNAQYWLGEAFYDQKRYKSALLEFRKVVDNHPEGNKVPDALLKLGYCYSQLNETAKAQQVLEQVVTIYPKSNPAALAKTKLTEIEDQ